MKDYVIIVDSTADLDLATRKKYNIDYVQMNISYNGKELPASLDWDKYSPKELYDLMRNGIRVMTTQVPTVTFETKFKEYLDKDIDILYLSCSSALSGSINTARIISEQLQEKYKDNKIICIDTLISCVGQGFLAIKAAKLKQDGKSIDEVKDYIETNKLKMHQFATVESLDYLKRAGRVKTSTAFFGNIFSVKPIIISDAIGQNFAMKKIKGRRASLLELVAQVKENIVNPENQIIGIGHADAIEDAEFIKEHLSRELKCAGFYINFIGPIVGASVGPRTIGVYFEGNEVTINSLQ